jgi:CrcB protein
MIARMTWALVGVAGALGAVARYGVGLAVGPREFPWATLSINVVGSFLIGIILTVGALDRLSDQATAALAVGFVGSFTTYSTFSWEVFVLGRADR